MGKMFVKSKKSIFVVLFLLLGASLLFGANPYTSAQQSTPDMITPTAYLSITPNPVGVDQQVNVMAWLQPIPPSSGDVFNGFTVMVTKPDGSVETLGPVDSWPMGAAFFTYTPNVVGTYSFKFSYPGQIFASTGEEYAGVESQTVDLTVQQEKIADWPKADLPDSYWTHPVNTENRDWNVICGSWLMCYYNSTYTGFGDATSGFNPYSEAPRSAHIMWTKPATTGGLAGGNYESLGEYSGLSYDAYGCPPIIMNGRLYVNTNPSLWGHFRTTDYEGFACYDLRTGEELWSIEGGGITHGQHFMSYTSGGQGIHSFLWDLTGTTWNVYDPFDGKWLMSFENTTAGTDWWWEDPVVYGSDGTMYVYILDGYANSLTMWNSTKAFEQNEIIGVNTDGLLEFAISPDVFDWEKGIEWAITIPDRNVDWHTPYSIFGISDGVAIAKSGSGGNVVDFDIAYDIETGEELWVHDKENSVQSFFSTTGEGVFVSFDLAKSRWIAHNIRTGEKMWESYQNQYPWGAYVGYAPIIAYGKLFSGGFDGFLHAFDLNTGREVWNFSSGNSGTETVMGTWPFWNGPIIADNVIFVGTGEETPTQPLTRGNKVYALDAQTGSKIWEISGYMSLRAIADGYLIGYNGYDSQLYCFGKGPSAISVEAPMNGVTANSAITIRGTVSDQSAGAKAKVASGEFTIIPAISDADQSSYMEHVYMQKPLPTTATGVQVKLTAVDSNNIVHEIGTTTSDINGNYGISWTPPQEGMYKIVAAFEGSESYYPSQATTYIGTQAASTNNNSGSAAVTTDTTIIIGLAIVILIVVIAAVLAIVLRRK